MAPDAFHLGMKKLLLAGLVGFAVGTVLFAVGREIVWAFAAQSAGRAISSSLRWVGTFQWLYDYQTFLTGILAGGGVLWQIRQAAHSERDRFEANRAAARAILPLTLSEVSEYAEKVSACVRPILETSDHGRVVVNLDISDLPTLQPGAVENLRSMVEASHKDERTYLFNLLNTLQILTTRSRGLILDRRRERIILDLNVHSILLNCAELYAYAAGLYEFARNKSDTVPNFISRRDVASGLFLTHVHGELRDTLVERYRLSGDGPNDP